MCGNPEINEIEFHPWVACHHHNYFSCIEGTCKMSYARYRFCFDLSNGVSFREKSKAPQEYEPQIGDSCHTCGKRVNLTRVCTEHLLTKPIKRHRSRWEKNGRRYVCEPFMSKPHPRDYLLSYQYQPFCRNAICYSTFVNFIRKAVKVPVVLLENHIKTLIRASKGIKPSEDSDDEDPQNLNKKEWDSLSQASAHAWIVQADLPPICSPRSHNNGEYIIILIIILYFLIYIFYPLDFNCLLVLKKNTLSGPVLRRLYQKALIFSNTKDNWIMQTVLLHNAYTVCFWL
jgi:hypothetical protein